MSLRPTINNGAAPKSQDATRITVSARASTYRPRGRRSATENSGGMYFSAPACIEELLSETMIPSSPYDIRDTELSTLYVQSQAIG